MYGDKEGIILNVDGKDDEIISAVSKLKNHVIEDLSDNNKLINIKI